MEKTATCPFRRICLSEGRCLKSCEDKPRELTVPPPIQFALAHAFHAALDRPGVLQLGGEA